MTDVQTASATHPAPGVLSRIFRTEQDGAPGDGHEQVVLCHDRSSGLKAIIAIHSTALGPALGGTRFFPYPTEEEALEDALRLSRGMSYKNALAGLDLGGGKAVIIGDPGKDKNEAMLRAYGRFVESLRGRYVTACDVGTYVQDMDVIARETTFVTGRSPEHGGSRRLLHPDRLRRLPGHARLRPGPLGPADAARPPGRRLRRRQGRPLPGRPPGRGRRPRGRHRRLRGGREPRPGRPPGRGGGRRHRGAADGRAGRLRPLRAGRRAGRPHGGRARRHAAPRWSAARPTTSWPTRASRRISRTAASCTRPTTW